MKAAFCLSGLSRSIPITYTSLKRHFIDKYNCDVFYKSWASEDASAIRAIELYRPKVWDLEYNHYNYFRDLALDLCEGHKDRKAETLTNHRARVLAMWYNISSCQELCNYFSTENNIQYDLVFRGRPDGWYLTNFDFNNIEPKTLYILGSKFNDGFAAGDWFTMSLYYSVLYDRINCYIPGYYSLPLNHWLCPHKLLEFHLEWMKTNGIKVVRLKDNIRVGKIWNPAPISYEDDVYKLIEQYDRENGII